MLYESDERICMGKKNLAWLKSSELQWRWFEGRKRKERMHHLGTEFCLFTLWHLNLPRGTTASGVSRIFCGEGEPWWGSSGKPAAVLPPASAICTASRPFPVSPPCRRFLTPTSPPRHWSPAPASQVLLGPHLTELSKMIQPTDTLICTSGYPILL